MFKRGDLVKRKNKSPSLYTLIPGNSLAVILDNDKEASLLYVFNLLTSKTEIWVKELSESLR